jgi:hypothetical protein
MMRNQKIRRTHNSTRTPSAQQAPLGDSAGKTLYILIEGCRHHLIIPAKSQKPAKARNNPLLPPTDLGSRHVQDLRGHQR